MVTFIGILLGVHAIFVGIGTGLLGLLTLVFAPEFTCLLWFIGIISFGLAGIMLKD